ncbi:MAG: hypothetical protein P0Y52_14845 [Candidatus Brevundimonas phytovorans]|nr:hypothetical protein [Brevundimonas sp.]WEK57801.1 MAG: hypothetical protein P0Y52_14845 [Brevundimonas sp.]
MSKRGLSTIQLDRVERSYLSILRVGVLGVATICLIAALFFAGDAAWRFFVSTKVDAAPTAVSGAEVASAMRAPMSARQSDANDGLPAEARARHARFVKDIFPGYYALYQRASTAYNKPEDKTLSPAELMDALGYDLGTYAGGEAPDVALFVDNPDYQAQARAAVTTAMADPAVVKKLNEYKVAQKTARQCSTQYVRRTVWDSNSTACSGWYYPPYGCNVSRNVPVEQCVAAYPEGIVSPLVAFGRADEAFRALWLQKADQNAAAAEAKRGDREALRQGIAPRLLLALQIAGGFLVVMFFFVLVALERHIRRIAERTSSV